MVRLGFSLLLYTVVHNPNAVEHNLQITRTGMLNMEQKPGLAHRHPGIIQLFLLTIPSKGSTATGPCQYCIPTGAMSMNIFRLCGDMSHVFSIIVLLLRLRVAKNASGELRERIRRRFVLCLRFACVCVRLSLNGRLSEDWPTEPHAEDEMCFSRWRRGIGMALFFPAAAEKQCLSYRHETLIFGHEFS